MEAAIPTGARQQRAAETQRHLSAAATAVFTEVGYHEATVAQITARAHTAHGTFYLYFENKQAVFAEVIRSTLAELYDESQVVWDGGDPATLITKGVLAFVEGFAARRGLWRANLEAMLGSPTIEQAWSESRQRFIDRIEARVLSLMSEPCPDEAATRAHAGAALVEWSCFTRLVFGADDPHDLGLSLAPVYFRAVFGGLFASQN